MVKEDKVLLAWNIFDIHSKMSVLKIIVAGSRDITDYNEFIHALTRAIEVGIVTPAQTFEIVSGGARVSICLPVDMLMKTNIN
jgi:hypothetical protein